MLAEHLVDLGERAAAVGAGCYLGAATAKCRARTRANGLLLGGWDRSFFAFGALTPKGVGVRPKAPNLGYRGLDALIRCDQRENRNAPRFHCPLRRQPGNCRLVPAVNARTLDAQQPASIFRLFSGRERFSVQSRRGLRNTTMNVHVYARFPS